MLSYRTAVWERVVGRTFLRKVRPSSGGFAQMQKFAYLPEGKRTVYNDLMETSYVPPEVAAQYGNQGDSNSDSGSDEQDSSSSSQSQTTDDSQADPFGNFGSGSADPSQSGATPGLSGSDPIGQQTGDQATPAGPQESLTLKQQLQMLSPFAFLQALAGQTLGEKTQEQQQAEQQAQMRQQQITQREQQSWQMQQQQQQAEQSHVAQQVDSMKSQGRSIAGKKSSVLFSQTTQGDQSEVTLVEQALKDAQHEAAKHRQSGTGDPGSKAKQGPASMGDLAQQKSGMQKASEMSMGE